MALYFVKRIIIGQRSSIFIDNGCWLLIDGYIEIAQNAAGSVFSFILVLHTCLASRDIPPYLTSTLPLILELRSTSTSLRSAICDRPFSSRSATKHLHHTDNRNREDHQIFLTQRSTHNKNRQDRLRSTHHSPRTAKHLHNRNCKRSSSCPSTQQQTQVTTPSS